MTPSDLTELEARYTTEGIRETAAELYPPDCGAPIAMGVCRAAAEGALLVARDDVRQLVVMVRPLGAQPLGLDDIAVLAWSAHDGPINLTATIRRLVEAGLLDERGSVTAEGRAAVAAMALGQQARGHEI